MALFWYVNVIGDLRPFNEKVTPFMKIHPFQFNVYHDIREYITSDRAIYILCSQIYIFTIQI